MVKAGKVRASNSCKSGSVYVIDDASEGSESCGGGCFSELDQAQVNRLLSLLSTAGGDAKPRPLFPNGILQYSLREQDSARFNAVSTSRRIATLRELLLALLAGKQSMADLYR